MKKFTFCFLTLLYCPFMVNAQLMINNATDTFEIDFTGFTAAGFSPSPTTGQLSSDTWSVRGWSDGELYFGGTGTTGDFARGTSAGGVTTGGVYSFVINGDTGSLGAQPTGTDFTPGSFILKIQNNTGAPIVEMDLAYTIWELNDQDRSGSFILEYTSDTNSWNTFPALDHLTQEVQDATPVWDSIPKRDTLTGLYVPDGEFFYLRWVSDDVGGSGYRDEIALDDIKVKVTTKEVEADFSYTGICLGESTCFSDLSFAYTGFIVSWEWDFGDGNTSTNQNPCHTYSTAANYTVTLIVTNNNAASDTISKIIDILPLADAGISPAGPFCTADAAQTLTAVDPGGAWSGTGITDTAAGTFDPAIAGAGTHEIIYTISDSCGDADTINISVFSSPSVSATTMDPVSCNGDCNGSGSISVNGGTTPYVYNWTDGAGNTYSGPSHSGILCADTYTITVTDGNSCTVLDSIIVTEPAVLTANVTVTETYCSDNLGSATVTANGGTPGYSYLWSSGAVTATINNLYANTYTVTVTDNNLCAATASGTVIDNPGPSGVSFNSQQPDCFGESNGQLTATPMGGTTPYTYQWDSNAFGQTNSTATGLTAGNYTVTVTDINGCTITGTTSLGQPQELIAAPGMLVICFGVNTTLYGNYTGGTGPVTHLWSTGETSGSINVAPKSDSTYTVTITDANGCIDIGIHEVTVHPPVSITLPEGNTVYICDGDVATLVAVGTGGDPAAPGYAYYWSTGDTTDTIYVAQTGTYPVTVSDGCSNEPDTSITVALVTSDFDYLMSSGTAFFTDQSNGNAMSWQWIIDGLDTLYVQNPEYLFPADGDYSVCLTVTFEYGASSCMKTYCDLVNVTGVGTEELPIAPEVEIFPVPVSRGHVFIRFTTDQIREISVYNITGILVKKERITAALHQLDLHGLPPGNYFLRIADQQNLVTKKLIILNH